MAGAGLVYNVAGINSSARATAARCTAPTCDGAEAVVRAAARAGVRRVVHTSSAASLGEVTGTVGSEASPHRGWYLSDYERSKHEGEVAVFATARARTASRSCASTRPRCRARAARAAPAGSCSPTSTGA